MVHMQQSSGRTGQSFTLISAFKVFYQRNISGAGRHLCLYVDIFCKSATTKTELDIVDGLILQFCMSVETLYGKDAITQNMHMHNHLKEVILDHGPVTSFWCFSFERFSGILGSITTNKRSVELQIMRKFILRFPKDIKLQFKGDFKFRSPDVSPSDWLTIYEFSYIATNVPLRGINLLNKSEISVSPCYKLVSFDTDDLKLLTAVYKVLYLEGRIEASQLTETIYKFGSFKIWLPTYGSKIQTRGIRSAKILAFWPAKNEKVLQDAFFISRHRSVLFYTFIQARRGTCHALLCLFKMVF